jgi:hypothetical protein
MGANLSRLICLALAGIFLCSTAAAQSKKKSKRPKPVETDVRNYYGGVFLIGDGGIPNGPCFRINGRVTSAEFFNELKSFNSENGVTFRRGTEEVNEFPDRLLLSLTLRDQPCPTGLQPVGTGVYLTEETMKSLKLSLYWKHGLELRPANKISVLQLTANPIEPYAKDLAQELPKRYLWSYELGVPAAAVPLTDSLVLIFRTSEGRIAARVAARL